MVSLEYRQAATEVLEILKHTNKNDVKKIPNSFINYLEKNCLKTYNPNLDYKKPIKDLNIKTKGLLGLIYLKYWANEKEQKEFIKNLK